jgi:hypothetical protein
VGLWFWLADDGVWHGALDCPTRGVLLGAHPLVEYADQYAGASAIEWSAKWANRAGNLTAALCTWGD